ncbi:transposase [Ktedonobacter sp. SOSP1-52]|uniref:transposase n=1 Tax=Ktedonobacter sp. SOSP1-52 TaxID=2778366 RepID=UPI001916193B|nr:transposase [Ktedonobacter sp. SOSP1-52]
MPHTCIKRSLGVAIRVPMHPFLPTSDAYAKEPACQKHRYHRLFGSFRGTHVHFLFLRHPTDLKPEEQKDLGEILQRHTDLAALYQLVQQFRALMHARCPEQLDDWVQQVAKTSFPELHHFVSGLRKDWDAVRAAFTVEWSNGMVEGAPFRRL